MFAIASIGNLKHLPFFGSGETWETYEAQLEEALAWLEVRPRQASDLGKPGAMPAPKKFVVGVALVHVP